MPVFLYILPHAQTRQSFESVGLFLFCLDFVNVNDLSDCADVVIL